MAGQRAHPPVPDDDQVGALFGRGGQDGVGGLAFHRQLPDGSDPFGVDQFPGPLQGFHGVILASDLMFSQVTDG